MSFYTSLSGLKGAQTDMSVISNNIANAGSIGFKRSKAQFGDIFASSPTQSTKMIAGQGQRLNGITQQFTQGSYESSEKTLDMAIVGEGMFVVKGDPPREQVTYTRNGAFTATPDRNVIDSTGQKLQLLPVDANGNVTNNTLAGAFDFVLPPGAPSDPTAQLVNVSIGLDGLVTATFANGEAQTLGKVAMATFPAMEGLRPVGDAHWQSSGESGAPTIDAATNGPMGAIRSGALERSNVDITEELVMLIGAQRNFQANAKAIEGASQLSQTIINMR
ncbi:MULTISPECIES: flagellar hook-basal body complex protein [unclassified Sphingopyxis]|jgi:flagellar hook protein FlgE|uniref:flagellar hook-basal body complex protein n=1 Tax=unclassified Sphingopyxis TaxID=2614943 RepID=UPI0028612D52|nr:MULTISPECIES: flagellar hook-basal body complex protein [unclassified Sphingopyxis]MDR6833467.1 flagellar hook protein FlgE [Sphingopyxis sp. BE122]MDR7225736.1 flagellar hook protein FlgE [Sphingopyxis sp. BE259]